MDIKTAKEELQRLKRKEKQRTSEYLKLTFARHSRVLDLSNHYLFNSSVKLLSPMLKKHNGFRYIVLKNCMLSERALKAILTSLANGQKDTSLRALDIANNRLPISPDLSSTISAFFSMKSKAYSLVLQGNLLPMRESLSNLLSQGMLHELNLYDCSLSDEVVLVLSEELSKDKVIRNLNIAFNSSAFTQLEVTRAFASAICVNSHIESLDLGGIENLGTAEHFSVLCKRMRANSSLHKLNLASLGFGDGGVSVVRDFLEVTPIFEVNFQNNCLSASGIAELFQNLPDTVSHLDVSYNEIKEGSAIMAIASKFLQTRSLRSVNLSHTMELEELEERVLEKLCESITRNDSLTEFFCEGVKISDNPDNFCSLVNEAISIRKLSLTYKISAVNCYPGANSTILGNLSLSETPEKIVSECPSDASSMHSTIVKYVKPKLVEE